MEEPTKKKGRGGRKKGSLNKATLAQEHFLDAWTKHGGPKTASKLVKEAVKRALGYECVESVLDAEGKLMRKKVWHEANADLLNILLPYIARKLPTATELTGKDGAPLSAGGPQMSFEGWTAAQIDAFITATAKRA